jgi:hypothetical protein
MGILISRGGPFGVALNLSSDRQPRRQAQHHAWFHTGFSAGHPFASHMNTRFVTLQKLVSCANKATYVTFWIQYCHLYQFLLSLYRQGIYTSKRGREDAPGRGDIHITVE